MRYQTSAAQSQVPVWDVIGYMAVPSQVPVMIWGVIGVHGFPNFSLFQLAKLMEIIM